MLALASLALLQQDRVVVVEWRHGLLWWIVIGLIAGWLAGKSPAVKDTVASPTSFSA
jgi:hypothetical protein